MQPSQVRARVLQDHESLRQRMEEIERLAEAVLGGERAPAGKLRQAATELLVVLTDHMGWEDRYLVPALRDADAWGPERVARFEADHEHQREELRRLLAGLEEPRQPAANLASSILQWLNTLHEDMREEEAAFLDKKVLRDDVIGIDVETG